MEEIFRNSICFVLYFTNCWRNQWKTLHASSLVGQCKGFVVPSHFPQFYPLHLPPKGDPNSEMVFQHQLAEFCSVGLQITGILPLSTEMCPWYLMSFSSMTVSHTHSFFHPQTSWFSYSQVYSWPVMLSFFFFCPGGCSGKIQPSVTLEAMLCVLVMNSTKVWREQWLCFIHPSGCWEQGVNCRSTFFAWGRLGWVLKGAGHVIVHSSEREFKPII